MKVYTNDELPQGSPEWFAARAGMPTASSFDKVMAKGMRGAKESVGRAKYLRTLAAEVITGVPAEAEWVGNRHTERGKEREDEARSLYCLDHSVEPERIGFVTNGNCGCSPDSYVGDGGLEIKDALPHIQIERLQSGTTLPGEHRWQVIGSLLVCEDREWWDFMSHCRGLPPLYIRTLRKDVTAELAELREGIDRFCEERDFLVKWVKAMA